MNRATLLFAAVAMAIAPNLSLGADGWTDSLKTARAAAKKAGKLIVIDFTGSDW